MHSSPLLYGALEAGGTKMVLAVFDRDGNLLEKRSIPTGTPGETVPEMLSFFGSRPLAALGIASFGPLCLDRTSPLYGRITQTPKLSWRDYPLLDTFRKALGIPVGLDTDVNAAALAEARLGAAAGRESCLYVTVGTGIGGGLVLHGRPVHGLIHPEIGHIRVAPEENDPMPRGVCPYHPHCLEGLASGPSLEKRWGVSARDLPEGHPAWELESAYLAQLCQIALMSFSPEKILLGGGVMQKKFLFPMIRRKTLALLGGYLSHPALDAGLEDLILPPGLDTLSGITGAFLLARQALEESPEKNA